jgi:glycosyltransferase involved in cell wall biosynthesis
MRVLQVIPSIDPSYGGPSIALIDLAKSLSSLGITSEIITTDLGMKNGVNYGQIVDFRGVKVRYFPRILKSWLPRDFALSPQLYRWLTLHITDYDVVHIYGLFSYPNSVAADIAYRAGIPYVIKPCGMLDPWCLKQRALKKRAYLKLVGDRLLKNASAVMFTTKEESNISYKPKTQPKSFIIPLGVDLSGRTKVIDDNFSFPADKKIILFLSRIDPKKGLDLLIPALKRLYSVRNDFIAVIAGNGNAEYETRIRHLVESSGLNEVTHFVGFVDGEKKYHLLEKASCFVLPSYQENFGVSVIEAMGVGCPVVISDQVNIYHDVLSAGAGRVVRCEVDDVFIAIDDLLNNDAARHTMSINGQKLVSEKYNWEKIGSEILQMYQGCLQSATEKRRN